MFNFGKRAAAADHIQLGGKQVEIPKLTITAWKKLFTRIETLPALIMQVMGARGSSDMTAYILAAVDAGLDEVVELVALVTDLDPAWIKDNVGLDELIDFIVRTVKKNNFSEAVKKFLAVFGPQLAGAAAVVNRESEPSTNG